MVCSCGTPVSFVLRFHSLAQKALKLFYWRRRAREIQKQSRASFCISETRSQYSLILRGSAARLDERSEFRYYLGTCPEGLYLKLQTLISQILNNSFCASRKFLRKMNLYFNKHISSSTSIRNALTLHPKYLTMRDTHWNF